MLKGKWEALGLRAHILAGLLGGVVVAATSGAVGAESAPPLNAFAEGDQPLACEFNLADDFGIAPLLTVPRGSLPPEAADVHLRVKMLRYPAAPGTVRSVGGTEYSQIYDDHIFIFHHPEERLIGALQDAMAAVAGELLRETVDCTFAQSKQVTFYSPFARDVKRGVSVAEEVLHVQRRFYVPSDRVPALAAAPLPARQRAPGRPITATEDENGNPRIWTQNEYPWIDLASAREVAPGEAVFAVDKATCEADGNFVVGTIGVADARRPGTVVRSEMIASNNYYGASGDPKNAEVVAASVNSEAYWCIPKREFCYQRIAFGDFGVRARKGDAAHFPPEQVYSMEKGLLAALQAAVVGACPPRIMEIRKY